MLTCKGATLRYPYSSLDHTIDTISSKQELQALVRAIERSERKELRRRHLEATNNIDNITYAYISKIVHLLSDYIKFYREGKKIELPDLLAMKAMMATLGEQDSDLYREIVSKLNK